MSKAVLGTGANVSRETGEALEMYAALLRKWSVAINLVGSNDQAEIWRRHIQNCAQMDRLIGDGVESILDIGSGAGLPGMVLAILRSGRSAACQVVLVEADKRKCAFLREVRRQIGVSVEIIDQRAEEVSMTADFVTARAVAPLDRLLRLCRPFTHAGSKLLLMKGSRYQEEIDAAKEHWSFAHQVHHDEFGMPGVILEIKELREHGA